MRRAFVLLHAGVVLATLAASAAGTEPAGPMPVRPLQLGARTINAEIASTDAQRARGLMDRDQFAADDGMLFLLPLEAEEGICMWMKDTRIALSVAFIDRQGRIVNIEDMAPLSEENHCAAGPARYALELNRGAFAAAGVGPGAQIGNLPPPDMTVPPPLPPAPTMEIRIGARTIRAELPDTEALWRRGLKFRDRLAEDGGMLFRLREGWSGQWCRSASQVHFPVTAAYLDRGGRVLRLADLAADSTEFFCADAPPAAYFLMVNRGVLNANSRVDGLPPLRQKRPE